MFIEVLDVKKYPVNFPDKFFFIFFNRLENLFKGEGLSVFFSLLSNYFRRFSFLEIEEGLGVICAAGLKEVVLMHCITDYPAAASEMNLRVLRTLQCAFGLPVGLSDHTTGLTIPVAAVALGACMIEKHFTLDRNLPGPDHRASLEPGELKAMIEAVREVTQALGDGVKRPTGSEEMLKKVMRRCIVAQTEICKGTAIIEPMLTIKRAGGGLSPRYLSAVVGRTAQRNIRRDEALTWSKIY